MTADDVSARRIVTRLEPAGECPDRSCQLPMVRVTFGRVKASQRVITVHDDGSWDGHPAWVSVGSSGS